MEINQSNAINYICGDERLIDEIKELWEGLNEHHKRKSPYFKDHYTNFSFETRKSDFLRKAKSGALRVELAIHKEAQKGIGYCVSSLDEENTGEVESIFISEDFRGLGIGEELMKRAFKWMDQAGAVKKVVTVASGNENAFGFYKKFGFYPRKVLLEQVKTEDGR
ncbi:MAG: GNAT family N-acetyltransferase [Bacillota bacterium]|nr:GNAT family N-acetyltransferase [Bacillota bacterium]